VIIVPKDPASAHLPDKTCARQGSIRDRYGNLSALFAGAHFPLTGDCQACGLLIVLCEWAGTWLHVESFTPDKPPSRYPRRAA
jgi:hypothetical protein